MLVSCRVLAASSAAVLAVAVGDAGAASAATIASKIPCVANLGIGGALTLPVVGSGFSPSGVVALSTSTASSPAPKELTSVNADPNGNIDTRVDPPAFRSTSTVEQSFNLIAIDAANPANTATSTFRQVRFGFDANPDAGRPARRVTYTARGFLPGKAVYAHFRFGGRTRRDVKIGIARGACGIVSKKMRLLPAKTRFGRWAIYMDQAPTYSKSTLLQARGSLVIQRTLR
ncbi:MAG: hypothetical protein QOJ85_4152 [Solirubrobacteraceae bacterium]|jgi:hypothetical protein|nr:hypothetical protein [Solirubrobacteraceae bacterium]MEA2240864.1 hypothetical protein [Solirubrobacteraceae bacterium]